MDIAVYSSFPLPLHKTLGDFAPCLLFSAERREQQENSIKEIMQYPHFCTVSSNDFSLINGITDGLYLLPRLSLGREERDHCSHLVLTPATDSRKRIPPDQGCAWVSQWWNTTDAAQKAPKAFTPAKCPHELPDLNFEPDSEFLV